MFGDPCHPPMNINIFFWVWIYSINEQWQGLCFRFNLCTNTSTDLVLDTSSIVSYTLLVAVYDISNDFAEAMGPKQTYYMRIDGVFNE